MYSSPSLDPASSDSNGSELPDELETDPLLTIGEAQELLEEHLGIGRTLFYEDGHREALRFAYYGSREQPQIKKSQVLEYIQFMREHPRPEGEPLPWEADNG